MTETMNPATANQTAILLLAHGTPNVLGEMAEYLSKVTNGRALPHEVIEELQHRYAEIGLRDEPLPEGPPLTSWTLDKPHSSKLTCASRASPSRASTSACATGNPTSRT